MHLWMIKSMHFVLCTCEAVVKEENTNLRISVQGHTLWPKLCSNKSTLNKNHLLMNQSRQQALSKFYMKYIPRCTQHILPIKQTDLQCCQLSHSINLLLHLNIKIYWEATAIFLAHRLISKKSWKQGHNERFAWGTQISVSFLFF